MEKEHSVWNDRQQINKVSMICHLVMIIVLTAAYMMEVVEGSRTIPYFILCMVLLWGPALIDLLIYRKRPDHPAIMRIMGYTYGFAYAFMMITSEHLLTFCYIIPMLIVLTGYMDYKFSLRCSAAVIVFNAIQIGMYVTSHDITPYQLVEIEIQIAVMLMVCAYVVVFTRLSIQINENKRRVISADKQRIAEMLEQVMLSTNNLVTGIDEIAVHLELLKSSVTDTKVSMQEVSKGTMETALSIQTQLTETEKIQNQVQGVLDAGNEIERNVKGAVAAIEEGNGRVGTMIHQVEQSELAEQEVLSEMKRLTKQAEDMQSILSIIRGVASQTSLLALNASIEAARAGEAGRGFSVVATEIGSLSNQTQISVENIGKMIAGLVEDIGKVVGAVDVLVDSNRNQHLAANETAGSFKEISGSSYNIKSAADNMQEITGRLVLANREIVQSVQTISAVTEEVSAHASTTLDSSENNQKIVEELHSIVVRISSEAERLRQLQEQ